MSSIVDSFHPLYKAILAKAASLGYAPPSFPVQLAQNGLLRKMIRYNIWTELQGFYNHYHDGSQEFSYLNWKNLTTVMTKTGTVNFSPFNGSQSDGLAGYYNTGLSPDSFTTYQLNNCSMFLDIKDEVLPTQVATAHCGAISSGVDSIAQILGNGVGVVFRLNNTTANNNVCSYGTYQTKGLWMAQRKANNDLRGFKDGVQVQSSSVNSVSGGMPNLPLYMCGTNNAGTAVPAKSVQRCFGFGSSLDGKEAILNTIWTEYKAICDAISASDAAASVTADGAHAILTVGDSHHTPAGQATSGITLASGVLREFNGTSLVDITTGEPSTANIGGLWKQLASNWKARTGYNMIGVYCAAGGSSYENDGSGDDWSDDSVLYTPMKTKANNCLAFIGVKRFKAIFISLGSADIQGATSLTTITTAAYSLYVRLKKDFPNTPIYITSPGRIAGSNLIDSRRATLKKITLDISQDFNGVDVIANAYSYSTWGLLQGDNIHLTTAAYNKLGEQIERGVNIAYSKNVRQVLAQFYDDLSTTHKNAYRDFVEGCMSDGNWYLLDHLAIYRSSTQNNGRIDLINFTGLAIGGTPVWTANDNLASSSGNYINSNFMPSVSQRKSSVNDVLAICKIGVNSTPAGTAANLFGSAVSTVFRLAQTVTPDLQYGVNGATSSYSGETKFADNSIYAIGRNAGNHYLYKNGTQVHTAAVAVGAAVAATMTVGAYNNGGSIIQPIDCQFHAFAVARFLGFDQSAFNTRLNTLIAALV